MGETGADESRESEQVLAWRGPLGERWLANHERLDHVLEPFGLAAMDALGDLTGANVLDIGCGTGETVADLAERVGPTGRVVGVDINADLAERARARYHLDQVDFRVADAATDELGHGYDAVLSRLGTVYFDDPVAAFAHIRASLWPTGRLAMVAWQPPAENEWLQVPMAAAADIIEVPDPPAIGEPGPFAFADADHARAVLEQAGFSDVEVTDVRSKVHLGEGPVDAAHFLLSVLPTPTMLDSMDRDTTASIVDAVEIALEHHGTNDLEGAAWLLTAVNS